MMWGRTTCVAVEGTRGSNNAEKNKRPYLHRGIEFLRKPVLFGGDRQVRQSLAQIVERIEQRGECVPDWGQPLL